LILKLKRSETLYFRRVAGDEFKGHSGFQATDGQMFFGGVNGFSYFNPDSLKDNSFVRPFI